MWISQSGTRSGRYTELGAQWEQRRRELLEGLPWHKRTRQAVADALGISLRTVERYEAEGAPPWYELALIGLAHAVKRKDGP